MLVMYERGFLRDFCTCSAYKLYPAACKAGWKILLLMNRGKYRVWQKSGPGSIFYKRFMGWIGSKVVSIVEREDNIIMWLWSLSAILVVTILDSTSVFQITTWACNISKNTAFLREIEWCSLFYDNCNNGPFTNNKNVGFGLCGLLRKMRDRTVYVINGKWVGWVVKWFQ